MLHTYKIDSSKSGHDATSWGDAFADVINADGVYCAYNAGDGEFYIIADDDNHSAMFNLAWLACDHEIVTLNREALSRSELLDRDIELTEKVRDEIAEHAMECLKSSVVDDLMPLTDAHGNMHLARKFIAYKSDPRDPELWTEQTLDELREIKRELDEAGIPDDQWGREVLEVDRAGIQEALTRAEQGERIFIATDEDGYYFAA